MAEALKKNIKKFSYPSKPVVSCKACCKFTKIFKEDKFIKEDDCLTLQDDLEGISFTIPRIDELSSGDDSDDDTSVYYDDSFVLSSLAAAVQTEYIRSLPKPKLTQPRRPHRQGASGYKALNSYVSLSKSWPAESELNKTENYQSSTAMESTSVAQKGYAADIIQVYSLDRADFRRKATDAITCKFDQEKHTTPFEKETGKFKHALCCHFPPVLPKMHYTSGSYPYFDLPKNALVLYLGSVKMKTTELHRLDLTRCIQTLLSRRYFEFVLLKIKHNQLVIEHCGGSESRKADKPETSLKRKRKKFLLENGEISGKENQVKRVTKDNVRNEESRSYKKGLLSCIGFLNSSKYQPLLQHNDSIHLKAYEALRRKKVFEFQFERIIFCGAEVPNTPENVLIWVYHVVRGNYNAVECHSIECDDQHHARSLGRALSNEIVASSGKTK